MILGRGGFGVIFLFGIFRMGLGFSNLLSFITIIYLLIAMKLSQGIVLICQQRIIVPFIYKHKLTIFNLNSDGRHIDARHDALLRLKRFYKALSPRRPTS